MTEQRLNVRCCCQPTKILGTLPWDGRSNYVHFDKIGGGTMVLPVREIKHYERICPEIASDALPIDVPTNLIKREPAYKAEGAPLDQLRLIPSFHEGKSV